MLRRFSSGTNVLENTKNALIPGIFKNPILVHVQNGKTVHRTQLQEQHENNKKRVHTSDSKITTLAPQLNTSFHRQ